MIQHECVNKEKRLVRPMELFILTICDWLIFQVSDSEQGHVYLECTTCPSTGINNLWALATLDWDCSFHTRLAEHPFLVPHLLAMYKWFGAEMHHIILTTVRSNESMRFYVTIASLSHSSNLVVFAPLTASNVDSDELQFYSDNLYLHDTAETGIKPYESHRFFTMTWPLLALNRHVWPGIEMKTLAFYAHI